VSVGPGVALVVVVGADVVFVWPVVVVVRWPLAVVEVPGEVVVG